MALLTRAIICTMLFASTGDSDDAPDRIKHLYAELPQDLDGLGSLYLMIKLEGSDDVFFTAGHYNLMCLCIKSGDQRS